MHSPHDEPGFDPRQILHDGCEECERRGEDPRSALAHMDPSTFRRALDRAVAWQSSEGPTGGELNIAHAEAKTLETLWLVALHMARTGVATIPGVHA